jgi:hypothetical protein
MSNLSYEEANQKLRDGEFENSKSLYSSLLDTNPEEPSYQAGYYIASYWDNRLDKIFSSKEGTERGLLLNELFEQFEKDYVNRKYPKMQPFFCVRECILGESSSQLRLGYHKEGGTLDKKIVWILCKNLLIIKDYKNAIEMIDYCRKKFEMPSEFYYYKAEALYHVNEEKKSRMLFRSTFLHFPDLVPLELILSEPVCSAIGELSTRISSEKDLKEYLPVYCLERDLLPEVPDYTREDVFHFFDEMNRLYEILQTDNKDLYFKIKCRMIQYGLTILDTFQGQINSDLSRKVRELLSQIDPGTLEKRDSNRRQKNKESD